MAKSGLLGGTGLFTGMGLGAVLMYFYDPRAGNRRRVIARDKLVSWSHQFNDAIRVAARDMSHRVQGTLAESRSLFLKKPQTPEVIEARIRSKLGRCVSHPSAINVVAEEGGRVILEGPILQREVEDLLNAVASVQGVTSIENRLEAHRTAEGVPALQGGTGRPGERIEMMQTNWAPATRLLAGSVGTSLMLTAVRKPGLFNGLLGLLGLGLFARAATNQEMGRLIGVTGGRRAVDLQKTIHLAAPVEEVFRLWTNYEQFPHFMSMVRHIEDLGDGRSRWTVAGPMGTEIQWNTVITKNIPNEIFAWKTEEDAPVAHAGIIRFEPSEEGGTRVHIRLSYNPPAGMAGHLVASLFGVDPKSQMDADLMRMKTFIETGNLPRDAAVPTGTSRQL